MKHEDNTHRRHGYDFANNCPTEGKIWQINQLSPLEICLISISYQLLYHRFDITGWSPYEGKRMPHKRYLRTPARLTTDRVPCEDGIAWRFQLPWLADYDKNSLPIMVLNRVNETVNYKVGRNQKYGDGGRS